MSCIEVIVAGTGSTYSPGRCTSSVIVGTPEETVVVDYGTCTLKFLASQGIDPDRPIHVFTHRHADHVIGAGLALFYLGFKKSPRPFRVIAGEDVLGVLESLRATAASMGSPMPPQLDPTPIHSPGAPLKVSPKLELTFITAKHTVPAYSILVDYDGIRVLVSGDTAPTRQYMEAAGTAQLALHEATLPDGYEELEEETGHSTVSSAIKQLSPARLGLLYHLTSKTAGEAREKTSVLTHILTAGDGDRFKAC